MATQAEVDEAVRQGELTEDEASRAVVDGIPFTEFGRLAETGRLQRIEAQEREFGASLAGRAQLGTTRFNEALARTIGFPVDVVTGLINMLGGPQQLLELAGQVGLPTGMLGRETAIEPPTGGPLERPIGGGQQVLELAAQAGLTPQVEAPPGVVTELIEAGAGAAGATAIPFGGILGAAAKPARPILTTVVPTLPRQIGREMIRGVRERRGVAAAAEVGLVGLVGVGEVAGAGVEEMITGEPETGVGRLIGGIGLSLSPLGIGGAIKTLARGIGNSRRITQQNMATFQEAGVTPSLGEVSGVRRSQFFQRALQRLPGGGAIFASAERTEQALANRINEITGSIGITDRATIGRAAQTGLRGFVERFKGKAEKQFRRLGELIPSGQLVSVENTQNTLNTLTRPITGAENLSETLANTEMRRIADAFAADLAAVGGDIRQLPFEVLSQLRSTVGSRLADGALIADIPTGELKQLYGALTRDMEAAALAIGPEARRAFERANGFYNAGQKRIETQIQSLLKKANPEDVLSAIELGGRKGATRIRAIRRSVTADEWQIVSSAIARRLGRTGQTQQDEFADVFSTTGFFRRYSELDPATKDALFGGVGTLKADLDNLAEISQTIGNLEAILANPSGTATAILGPTAIGGAVITGAAGQPGIASTILLAMAATNGASRLITNPKFVNYLVRLTQLPAERIPGQLARAIEIVGVNDPDTNIAIQEFIGNLRGTGEIPTPFPMEEIPAPIPQEVPQNGQTPIQAQ